MGQIFNQVGQAFVQAIPTIIFIALLVYILRRLFFRPLSEVLKARADQTQGALARARERLTVVEAKTAQYEAAWLKARQEIYALREADRQKALAERDQIIQRARQLSDNQITQAKSAIAAEAEMVGRQLRDSSAALASEITDAILSGGPMPTGPSGEEAAQ